MDLDRFNDSAFREFKSQRSTEGPKVDLSDIYEECRVLNEQLAKEVRNKQS